jgi:hypothetical protein
MNRPKKAVSRICAVSTALGIALAAGAATAASAVAVTPAQHVVTNATAAQPPSPGGDHEGYTCVIVLMCN